MRKVRISMFNLINYTWIGLFALTAIYPFVHTLAISFSSNLEADRAGLHIIPLEWDFTAWSNLFKDSLYWRSYLNSTIITAIGPVLHVLVCSAAGYALSKDRLPFRKPVMFLLIFSMLFSGGLIPHFILIKSLGLMNTWSVYIIPGLTNAFNIIIFMNFFRTLPEELEESAKMDGCSDFGIFGRIILPLSMPVLATVLLWSVVAWWNNWSTTYFFIQDQTKYTLAYVLQKYLIQSQVTDFTSEMDLQMQLVERPTQAQLRAVVTMAAVIPTLVLYPFLQKYFVKGITLGSIKG